jgi:hypothetical protein
MDDGLDLDLDLARSDSDGSADGGYLVARAARGPTSPSLPGSSPARLILDERYARGEIEEEEYRRRRVELW